jgi:hypothetical protein
MPNQISYIIYVTNKPRINMPRKSKAQRIKDSEKMLQEYRDAGLGGDTVSLFLYKMISSMKRGKYPTTGQRAWLDKIAKEGVPEPKGDLAYIAEIDEAISVRGLDEKTVQILFEFRGKLMRGWNLSEKQKAWSDRLILKAFKIKDGTHWTPGPDLCKRLDLAVECSKLYSRAYWNSHAGGMGAINTYLAFKSGQQSFIEERDVLLLLKSVKGSLRKIENPKHAEGTIVWVDKTSCGLVVSKPYINNLATAICYDVLVNGSLIKANVERVFKRRVKLKGDA